MPYATTSSFLVDAMQCDLMESEEDTIHDQLHCLTACMNYKTQHRNVCTCEHVSAVHGSGGEVLLEGRVPAVRRLIYWSTTRVSCVACNDDDDDCHYDDDDDDSKDPEDGGAHWTYLPTHSPITSVCAACWCCSSKASSLCSCFLFCRWKFSANWSFRDPSMSARVMASPYSSSSLLQDTHTSHKR